MDNLMNDILTDLMYVGIGALLFLTAYLSNMSFSLFYNIKVLEEEFDKEKLKASITKLVVVVVGLALLCISITILPRFVNYVGLTIPNEYVEIFSNLAILTLFVSSACRYVFEAYGKFKQILSESDIEIM